jgi:hypothetical protein
VEILIGLLILLEKPRIEIGKNCPRLRKRGQRCALQQ